MRHKNKYVIGYDDDYNPVYGKDVPLYAYPMTFKIATKRLKELVSKYPKAKAVYKLVKVKEVK